MREKQPKLAILVVSYNRRVMLLQCIESVLAQVDEAVPILVYDNASSDQSVDALQERYADRIEIVASHENLGGAGGFAAGMALLAAQDVDMLLLLDCDVVLEMGCIAQLAEYLQQHPHVGVCSPTILRSDGSIQELGAYLDEQRCDIRLNRSSDYSSYEYESSNFYTVDYVPACCALVRREVIAKVGVFITDFFIYWDDIEWCYRVRAAGYQIACFAQPVCHHYGGGSHKSSLLPTYYYWRNRIYFWLNYFDQGKRAHCRSMLRESIIIAWATSKTLGKHNQARIILLAAKHGLGGQLGRWIFQEGELVLDETHLGNAAKPEECCIQVEHLFETHLDNDLLDDNAHYQDHFGKQMLGADIRGLLEQYQTFKAEAKAHNFLQWRLGTSISP